MAKETKLAEPSDVENLQIESRFITQVQERKITELNTQNTLLLALANQQNEEIGQLREAIDELSKQLENRQQRRAKPAAKKGKAKK